MLTNNNSNTHVNLAIWGMHRSGTSLLCSLLAECGVYFGEADELVPPNEENPNGFWENTRVRELNNALLMATGCDWDHISRFDAGNIARDQLLLFTAESEKILEDLSTHSISGIKEPRMCLLTSAWGSILKDSVDVFVYRHPAEIAKSLSLRNDIPYEIGLCLCEYYLVNVLNYLSSREVIAVSHQDLLQKPVAAIQKLSTRIQNMKGASTLAIPETLSSSVVDMDYYRARLEQEVLPETLELIWNNLASTIPFSHKLDVSEKSSSLLTEYDRQVSDNSFLAARRLGSENRAQRNLLETLGQNYETAKKEIDLLHENARTRNATLQARNNVIQQQDDTLSISDSIVVTLGTLNRYLPKFTGRFFQLCLPAVSVLARLLGISALKTIDKKLPELSARIKTLTEQYESKRKLDRNESEPS